MNIISPPHPSTSLWPSGNGARLRQNRLWVRRLSVWDTDPMFIEPSQPTIITWVLSGLSGYIWLDTKIEFKKPYQFLGRCNLSPLRLVQFEHWSYCLVWMNKLSTNLGRRTSTWHRDVTKLALSSSLWGLHNWWRPRSGGQQDGLLHCTWSIWWFVFWAT